MKKNRLMRLASGLMVAVLLTTCAISGTFAKYTSQVTGSDSVKVAKWEIKVNDEKMNDSVTFDLFETGANYDNDINGSNVVDEKLAPGTAGSFDIDVENASEVTASYTVTYTISNPSNIPVKFYSDASMAADKEITPTGATYTVVTDKVLDIGAAADTQTVYWQWDFERGEDVADTTLGIAAQTEGTTPQLTVTATVEATQVN